VRFAELRFRLSIAQMPPEEIRAVIDTWAEQSAELGALPDINSVIVFENHGEAMGASNPHWSPAALQRTIDLVTGEPLS
jgi:hypothetical protein